MARPHAQYIDELAQALRQRTGMPRSEAERIAAAVLPVVRKLESEAEQRALAGATARIRRRASVLWSLEPEVANALSEIAEGMTG